MIGLEFDSSKLPPEARFPAWSVGMPFYDVSTFDNAAFSARIKAWLLSPVIVVDADLSPIRIVRTDQHIRADHRDELAVHLVVTGGLTGNVDQQAIVAGPGEIVLHDRREPFQADFAASRTIAFTLPRPYLEEVLPDYDLHGMVLRGGMANLLRAVLYELPTVLANSDPSPPELARLLRDLLAAAAREVGRTTVVARHGALRSRVKRHISREMSRALTVEDICGELGVSRSLLYRAFEREGGIAKYVQAQRLARLHRLLCDPAERRSISELAAEHGFSDMPHFSRLFRKRFGYGARTLRRNRNLGQEHLSAAADLVVGDPVRAFNVWEDSRI